ACPAPPSPTPWASALPLDPCLPTRLCLNRLPAMHQCALGHLEEKVVAPRCPGLLFRPGDGHAFEMTEQECPHTAGGHDHNWARARRRGANLFHCASDTGLGVDGTLPAADMLAWPGKEGIGGCFKLRLRQVPRGRAIIFPQRGDWMKRQTERCG